MVYSGCTTFVSCKPIVDYLFMYCFSPGSATLLTFSWLLTKKVCGYFCTSCTHPSIVLVPKQNGRQVVFLEALLVKMQTMIA